MFNLGHPYPNAQWRLWLIVGISCLATFGGCRRAAYTEMYIEQLNNEHRLLEDRIYEYDSAYRQQELEIASLHGENERLRNDIATGHSTRSRPRALDFEEIPPASRGSKNRSAPNTVPDAQKPSQAPSDPSVIESEPMDLEPPRIELPSKPSALNEGAEPSRVADLASGTLMSAEDSSVTQAVAISNIGPEISTPDSDSNHIDVGTAAVDEKLRQLIDVDATELQAFSPHLDSPNKIVSAMNGINQTNDTGDQVVELSFHPAFTRAIDADNVAGDESIRMVLQPKLASGSVVPTDGHLTIAIVDPFATNPQNPDLPFNLGRWTFTPEQLEPFYDPVGSAKGYRFEMGPLRSKPIKSEAIIFVRMEYEDGRKLVNQFTVHLDANPKNKPIWTARAK